MADEAKPTGFSALLGFFKNALGVHETRKVRVTDSGRLHVADGDPTEGEFRTAICFAGVGAAVVPGGSAMAAIAAIDILNQSFPAGKTRLALMATRDLVAGNTCLGWALTWNAGNAVTAKDRLKTAIDTPSKYVAAGGAANSKNANSGVIFVPFDTIVQIPSDGEITDVYYMPLSSASTIVGNQVLSGVAS